MLVPWCSGSMQVLHAMFYKFETPHSQLHYSFSNFDLGKEELKSS